MFTKTRTLSFLICLCTCFLVTAEEIDLSEYEATVYSQNGEDGVIQKIFEVIEPESRFCVELGAFDGITGSNTYLLRSQGWDCALIDRTYEIPEYNLHRDFITAENINHLMEKYSVPKNLGMISLDIDYNDFYIWHALDKSYKPALMLIEYNGAHLPHEDKVVKYRSFFVGEGTNYFGASILALYNLGRSKGYSLVYADKGGVNLFFVRDDLLQKHNVTFKNMNNVEKLYRRPTYGQGPNGGHRADYKNRDYVTSISILEQK